MSSVLGCVIQGLCGLRCRLLLLVLLACAPLIALAVHKAGDDRRRQSSSWRQRTQRVTQVAQREEEKILGQTRQLLLAVAESVHVRTSDARNTKKLMNELFASYPRYANLGVFRTNGEVLASALPLRDKTGGQIAFQRAMNRKAFAVGDLITTNPDASETNKTRAIIYFAHPVFGQNNQIQGVVFATLDWSWYSRFTSELPAQMPRNATWTEVNREGRILVRYPNPERWIGKPVEFSVPDLDAPNSRTLVERSSTNGHVMVYGFGSRKSEFVVGPVTTVLSIPRDQLFAEADRTLRNTLQWSAVALALALSLGWFGSSLLVMRPVRALAQSSARLASGDLRARTGLPHSRDELGELTKSFDQMAQALEEREIERQRARDKLQVLSHRLVEVQETERRQIARELHDEVGQTLTVAEMHLQSALASPESAAIEERLVESIQAIEQVQEQVRDLSLNLRPSMLDDLGLEPALRWYTNRSASAADIDCHFKADALERRLESIIETECFRVGQEALTNVTRHSGASSVHVELRNKDGQLHLHVKDDGIGFDVANVRDSAVRGSSLGLLSMEERATLAGGGLEILSAPGRGTEVHAWFPLKYRKENPELTS